MVEDGHTCVRAAQAPRWFKCIRPDHPPQGGVMLCTVQCRHAAACARKSPPRVHSKETRQDKTCPEAETAKMTHDDILCTQEQICPSLENMLLERLVLEKEGPHRYRLMLTSRSASR
jgi:hypothetical protein